MYLKHDFFCIRWSILDLRFIMVDLNCLRNEILLPFTIALIFALVIRKLSKKSDKNI
jgi:hypothetical protein